MSQHCCCFDLMSEVHCQWLNSAGCRDFADSGSGNRNEIDELKAAEHYKLDAAKLRGLPFRRLPGKVCMWQAILGVQSLHHQSTLQTSCSGLISAQAVCRSLQHSASNAAESGSTSWLTCSSLSLTCVPKQTSSLKHTSAGALVVYCQ